MNKDVNIEDSKGTVDNSNIHHIKLDKGEVLKEESKSICPDCRKIIDCQIIFRDNRVYMRKACDEHGKFEVEIYSNADDYVYAENFNKPGSKPLHYQRDVVDGCPDDCGLCPDHKQHTCIGVIEITDKCNLNCPLCFAQTSGSFSLPLEKVKEMVDLYMKCEGKPEVLQISGGEPTVHPDIFKILEYVGEKGIVYPLLNTNGIKLADREFARKISETMENKVSYKGVPIIYIQFDGFDDDIYRTLRGRPLLDIKMKALENCAEFGMNVTLVPAIVNGVNDHQIGKFVEFMLENDNIKMINYQPGSLVGRYELGLENDGRITIPDLLEKIESQTNGLLKKQSFINVPCPYPVCSACTYLYKQGDDVLALTDFFDVEDYIDGFINRTMPDEELVPEVHEALDALLSMSAVAGSEKTGEAICTTCGVAIPNVDKMLDNINIVSVHHFMDEYNFDLKRCMKCCVTEILPNGDMIPFCVYNNLRRKDLKSEFGKMC
jgi:uncharacterized radical SAM superfamily Fe-S cluster-containing enzyme